jgi:hypothetical protein
MKTPSLPPEETRRGLATLYDTTFPALEEYRKFTVNHLGLWGNTMEYRLFDTLYVNHWNHTCTIKKLREQATALLEEANRINERDMMIQHEIESHVRTITRSDLRQRIKNSQHVQVVTSPTPLPGLSWWPDYFHLATYGWNYSCQQYQCFQCGNPTHFEWDCPLYIHMPNLWSNCTRTRTQSMSRMRLWWWNLQSLRYWWIRQQQPHWRVLICTCCLHMFTFSTIWTKDEQLHYATISSFFFHSNMNKLLPI